MKGMKAQVAIEFMIILGALLLIAASVAVMSTNNMAQLSDLSLQMEANEIADSLGSKINTAFLEGDGFSTTATIPSSILSRDYELSVRGNYIYVSVDGISIEKPLLSKNVTQGSVAKGDKALRNVRGNVVISDA
ncbi:MAG: hypothetical protein DRO99_04870 [Candidatus Aenigmatarchaeota archaeon]|nr:MAG: hypothetical protein DRO99_04870 [Candidatus Aenigmarchaeota archaeon]